MQHIINLASQLGKAIADSPAGQALKHARELVTGDPAAMKLMREFQTQAEKVAKLEEQNLPISAGDKQTLATMQEQLAENDHVRKLTEAQVDYMDLIRQASETIQEELLSVEGQPRPQAQA